MEYRQIHLLDKEGYVNEFGTGPLQESTIDLEVFIWQSEYVPFLNGAIAMGRGKLEI